MGGVVWGDKKSCDVTDLVQEKKAPILAHTHPGNSPHSPDDIAVMIAYPHIQHSMVIGSGGALHRLSRTPDTIEVGSPMPTQEQWDQTLDFIRGYWGKRANVAFRDLKGQGHDPQEAWQEAMRVATAATARATHLDYQYVEGWQ
jgi:hypothetical protein